MKKSIILFLRTYCIGFLSPDCAFRYPPQNLNATGKDNDIHFDCYGNPICPGSNQSHDDN